MKVVHLSVGDPFTAKWVNSQAKDGHEVHLIMLEPEQETLIGVKTHILPFTRPFGYFLNVFHLKLILKRIKPDLLHVHYATGNGTLGRLSGYHPAILSVWGSDVMLAPHESKIMHRLVLKNLLHYDWVCSTSQIMANHTLSICPNVKNLSLTPIGVDIDNFYLQPKSKITDKITVGTVKALEPIYGIDILIRAFAKSLQDLDRMDPAMSERLQLMIIGGGTEEDKLRKIAVQLNIHSKVKFIGRVPHQRVPKFLNLLDIFVAMSRAESFGVALLEAAACELPVIASKVGGIPEVVLDKKTGFLIESEDVEKCSKALTTLILNPNLRNSMGKAGRDFVCEKYNWGYCMGKMYSVYNSALRKQ